MFGDHASVAKLRPGFRSTPCCLVALANNVQDVFNETRTILEPAGAVALAGAKAYLQVRLSLELLKLDTEG